MFSELLAKIKNETKIKTSLRSRGPPGVSGALRSVRILRIGRIGSDNTASAEDDQRLLLHHCLFSPAHWFYSTVCLAPPTDSTSLCLAPARFYITACLAPPTDSTALSV